MRDGVLICIAPFPDTQPWCSEDQSRASMQIRPGWGTRWWPESWLSPGPSFRRVLLCSQASCRPPPPRAGHDALRRARPAAPGRPTGSFPRSMPTRGPPNTHGSRGGLQFRPSGPGPPPGADRARPKKIVFEDELPSRALLGIKKPVGSIPGGHMPRPHPVPDYKLKYPAVSSERERRCYAAVFQDQYTEFLDLQQELGSAQAKLQRLEALLTSLPPPRSQKEAQVAARVRREFEKKRMDPSFLDKQARCRYLKGKLRHLKTQIQEFDNRGDSEDSVYF